MEQKFADLIQQAYQSSVKVAPQVLDLKEGSSGSYFREMKTTLLTLLLALSLTPRASAQQSAGVGGTNNVPSIEIEIDGHRYQLTVTLTPLDTPPKAPSGLTAQAVSATQIALAWQVNSADETGFIVMRKTGSLIAGQSTGTSSVPGAATGATGSTSAAWGDYKPIAVLPPKAARYDDIGLSPNTLYAYKIRAIGRAGSSDYSNEATATTPQGSAADPFITGFVDSGGQRLAVALPGDTITLTGRDFGSAAGQFFLNGILLPTVSWSDTKIVVKIPLAQSASPFNWITVMRPDGRYESEGPALAIGAAP